jgi:hypothetical protein
MRAAGVVGIPETPQAFATLGVHISQPDLPHWAVQVVGWLRMVRSINDASGREGMAFQQQLKGALENGESFPYIHEKTGKTTMMRGPQAVYAIYQSYTLHMEAEKRR